jgi:predicted dehydrogenase
MTTRACVVGVGYLGRHHARIYADLEGVDLVAVADTDEAAAREVADQYGCRAYADFREALGDVDAVSIVTPTSSHHEVGMACLRAGKDVLIEKPITATVAEADELILEAGERGALLQVGHLERYNPAVVALAGMVTSPVFIESERVSPMQGRGLDVDVTLDLMIHDIDIVMSLLGGAAPTDVRVVGAKVLTEKVDVAKAWVEFEGGVTALITASRISGQKQRLLKLYQEDSFVVLDYQNMSIRRHVKSGAGIAADTLQVESREPLKEEIEDFIQCIRQRRQPRVSGIDGREALRVALDITGRITAGRSAAVSTTEGART